jgi:hypothetical protein
MGGTTLATRGLNIPATTMFSLLPGWNLTQVTRLSSKGGPSGTVVATLTLTYSGGNLLTVTKHKMS